MTAASDRLDRAISEGRLIRGKWSNRRGGVCLLAALSPNVALAKSHSVCPAEIMPQWLARLTPGIDDLGSKAAWPAMIARYADLARRWHVLDAAAWDRLSLRALAIARGDESLPSAYRYVSIEIGWLNAGLVAKQEWRQWDRMTSELFDAIEAEIGAAQ